MLNQKFFLLSKKLKFFCEAKFQLIILFSYWKRKFVKFYITTNWKFLNNFIRSLRSKLKVRFLNERKMLQLSRLNILIFLSYIMIWKLSQLYVRVPTWSNFIIHQLFSRHYPFRASPIQHAYDKEISSSPICIKSRFISYSIASKWVNQIMVFENTKNFSSIPRHCICSSFTSYSLFNLIVLHSIELVIFIALWSIIIRIIYIHWVVV